MRLFGKMDGAKKWGEGACCHFWGLIFALDEEGRGGERGRGRGRGQFSFLLGIGEKGGKVRVE